MGNPLPDVIGYTMQEAKEKLEAQGYEIGLIEVTTPPKHKITEYDLFFKVIRTTQKENNKIDMLICKPL